MKTTFIATVLNEEENISKLLKSLFSQKKKIDEIIIVDGGSGDKTTSLIKKYKSVQLVNKKGNRAVGRNEGVRRAKGDIILFSDSGCILDNDWVKNITEPFKNKKTDVVAGFYASNAKNSFEKSLAPYILVMPDRARSNSFLPSARSMALRKEVFEKLRGFPEKYSHNEDYVFAMKLKDKKANIVFKENAIAYWIPRKNIFAAFTMFFSFAFGDAQSGILRPKVFLIFLRYVIGFLLLVKSLVFIALVPLYFIWAVAKNYKYVKRWQAFLFLPLLQVLSDLAVIIGTIWGTLKKQ